jgi:hypothetical protein
MKLAGNSSAPRAVGRCSELMSVISGDILCECDDRLI